MRLRDLLGFATSMALPRAGRTLNCLWELTYRCTARCAICVYWKKPTPRRTELSLEQICAGLGRIRELGCRVVNFTGGEPTLRPDLEEIVSHASGLGMWTSMVTNGYTLRRERLIRLREAGLDHCMVSLDSLRPELHDGQRGLPGSHDRVLRLLEWLSNDFMQGHRSGGAMCVLTRDNVGEVEGLVQLASRIGIFVAFQPYHEKKTGGTALSTVLDAALVHRLLDLKRRYGNVLNATAYLRGLEGFPTCAPAGERLPCRAGERYFSIDPRGGIHPCVDLPAVGHVLETDLSALRSQRARSAVSACPGCWYSFRGEADASVSQSGKLEKLRLGLAIVRANAARQRRRSRVRRALERAR